MMGAVDRPGLYIIEAPMGIGKTEAALFAAYLLISRGFNSGLYFGLPTRLTSERIHNRVSDYLREATDGTEQPGLSTGRPG